MAPRVLVLLAAYNGERYLREQIDSVLAQEGEFVLTLRIRDDGSSDGSAGSLQDDLHAMDIVFAQGACTDSNFAHQFALPGTFAPLADYTLLAAALRCAEVNGVAPRVGNILSSDNFYNDGSDGPDPWRKMGVLAVEMECAGLYMTAARLGKRALGILTVSDHLYQRECLSAEERQTSFTRMMELALDTAVEMASR